VFLKVQMTHHSTYPRYMGCGGAALVLPVPLQGCRPCKRFWWLLGTPPAHIGSLVRGPQCSQAWSTATALRPSSFCDPTLFLFIVDHLQVASRGQMSTISEAQMRYRLVARAPVVREESPCDV